MLCYYYVSNDTDEMYLVETKAWTCDNLYDSFANVPTNWAG